MDYSKIISKAFAFTKSNRYLWWLGILAALTEGGYARFYQFNTGNYDFTQLFNKTQQQTPTLDNTNVLGVSTSWLSSGAGIIIVLALLVIAVSILVIYVSYSARAGLMSSINRLEDGNNDWGFKEAFHDGRKFAGRLFCLGLLYFLGVLLVMIIFAVPITLLFLWQQPMAMVSAIILIFIGAIVLFALAVYISLTFPLAERKIVLEEERIVGALRSANDMLWKKLSSVFITYLVNVGLGLAYGMAIWLGMLIVGGLLFGIGYLFYKINMILMIIYAIIFGVVFCAVLIALGGIFTAFLSSYWTISYRMIIGAPKSE